MELAMRSVGIASVPNPSSDLLDTNQRDVSGDRKNLEITASSRLNSNVHLNGNNETRSNITVEEGDLPVGEKNLDRETHAH